MRQAGASAARARGVLENGVPPGDRRGLRARPHPGPSAAARLASRALDPAPVLGLSSAVGEMASHLPAWEDDGHQKTIGARPKARPVVQINQYTSVDTAPSRLVIALGRDHHLRRRMSLSNGKNACLWPALRAL